MDGKEAFRRRHLLSGGCTVEEEETDPTEVPQDSNRLDTQQQRGDEQALPPYSMSSGSTYAADINYSVADTAVVNQRRIARNGLLDGQSVTDRRKRWTTGQWTTAQAPSLTGFDTAYAYRKFENLLSSDNLISGWLRGRITRPGRIPEA
ncbi:hypothetical protein HPB50_000080 [Hyalomma asiaticum]|uniref:Uncharacterized protein n=1 Tax=Hyalomma asiaticum TaxID=266040 RepID=A0ACB7T2Z6_HYAAI|nr:hypothetical protein HPB50_000080 [Hyalomma asiaticum]